MTSIPIQSSIVKSTPLIFPSFSSHKPFTTQFKLISPFKKSRAFCPHLSTNDHKFKPLRRFGKLHASAATEEALTEEISISPTQETLKPSVGKPKVVLRFIWMEKNIGLGLDQEIPGHGTVPLSPYFFWPRKDAWEELKTTLENKPWISQKKMIILLNQATDIINLWQQGGGNLS